MVPLISQALWVSVVIAIMHRRRQHASKQAKRKATTGIKAQQQTMCGPKARRPCPCRSRHRPAHRTRTAHRHARARHARFFLPTPIRYSSYLLI